MKTLGHYPSRIDAEIVKNFLESNGIKAFITSDDEGGLHPALGAQLGATLNVSDEDYPEAQKVIQTLEAAPPLKEGE